MTSDKKNIDRLYQEKFKDLEISPSDHVWENISAQLHSKKKRRVIPLWIRLSGAAAILLLFIALSNLIFSNDSISPENPIVNTNTPEEPTKAGSEPIINKSSIDNAKNLENDINEAVVESSSTTPNTNSRQESNSKKQMIPNKANSLVATNENSRTNSLIKNSNIEDNIPKKQEIVSSSINSMVTEQEKVAQEDIVVTDEKTTENTLADKEKVVAINQIEELINEDNVENEIIEKTNRWSVASYVAPVYFNTLGSGSSIHSQFNNNSKTGAVNMSYGVSGSYAINDKLNIRTGINKLKLGYSTNNAVIFNNAISSSNNLLLRNVNLKSNVESISVMSANSFSFAHAPNLILNELESTIDQQFGFIEVPVEIEYTISNRTLGFSVIGGFSTLFLNENDIYSKQNGQSVLLGSATNINKMSYSANFGLGLNYKISKAFNFNFEPMFKYQLNTFNNTSGNFRPFFIGIYSGLAFKF